MVTILVTIRSVTRNKEASVEGSVTDQQLVEVSAVHGSKPVPQSITASTFPIIIYSLHRHIGFSFEVGFVSSLMVNKEDFLELQ